MQSPALSVIKSLINISIIGLILLFSQVSLAASYDFNESSGLNKLAQQTGYNLENTSPEPIIGNALNIIFSLLGIIFLALIIYGGILWMTDTGNAKNVERAKNIITQAVSGLVIIIAAYAITRFAFNYLRDDELGRQNTIIDQKATTPQ